MLSENGSLWRQIGATLTAEIERGILQTNSRLPSSAALAARFGVNRHTVLRALADLQARGIVRMERGRGAYAVVNSLEWKVGPQQWFEQNLLEYNRSPVRTVISVVELPASADIANALQIAGDDETVRVTLLGEANDIPINYGYHFFPARRLPGIAEAFRAFGSQPTAALSFREIFRSVGISDFRRRTLLIRALPPTPDQARYLNMAPSDYVLRTEVTSVAPDDAPVVHAFSHFCASRIALRLDL